MSKTAQRTQTGRPGVELRLPADGAYLTVLRTTTAALAARLDFTIDDIEDLRIAVGEASAMVLPYATPGAELTAAFETTSDGLVVEVSVAPALPGEPDFASFAWQVLVTLSSTVEADHRDGRCRVRLSMRSSAAGTGA